MNRIASAQPSQLGSTDPLVAGHLPFPALTSRIKLFIACFYVLEAFKEN